MSFDIDIRALNAQSAQEALLKLAETLQDIEDKMSQLDKNSSAFKNLQKEALETAKAMGAMAKVVESIERANSTYSATLERSALAEKKLENEEARRVKTLSETALAEQKASLYAAKLEGQDIRNATAALRHAEILERRNQKLEQSIQPFNKLKNELAAVELSLKNAFAEGTTVADPKLAPVISQYRELAAQIQHVKEQMSLVSKGNVAIPAYSALTSQLREYEATLKNAIASGKVNEASLQKMASEYMAVKGNIANVDNEFKRLTDTMNNGTLVGRAFASFLGNTLAMAFTNILHNLNDFRRQISAMGVEMDGIRNTFAAGARGWREGGQEMEYVADMANRLGLNLQGVYQPYAKFMTSFTRSGGSIQQSRQIFEDLSTAMVSLHLNAAQMEGVFVALEQMANKSTVQSEELKRQLSNYLPGAFELAAESMGITAGELTELMKKGLVVSKDFLPKFAETVKNSLGKQVGIAVDQYNAHLNRMQSQTFIAQTNLGSAWNTATLPLIKFATEGLTAFNKLTKNLEQNAVAIGLLQTAFTAGGVAALGFAANTKVVTGALTYLKATAISTELIMNGLKASLLFLKSNWIVLSITAITAALYSVANAASKAKDKYAELAVQQRDAANHITGLLNEYSALHDVQNRSAEQQLAYNGLLMKLREEYPAILEYVQGHNISLRNLTEAQAEAIAQMTIEAKKKQALKTYTDELNDANTSLMTKIKQAGVAVSLVLRTVATGFVTFITGILQALSRLVAVSTGWISSAYDKAAAQAKKVPLVGNYLSDFLTTNANSWNAFSKGADNADKSLGDFNTRLWNVVKDQKAYLESGGVTWKDQQEAMGRLTDTLKALGQEQDKVKTSLLQAKSAMIGFNKESKKTKKEKTKKEKSPWENLASQISEKEDEIKSNLLLKNSVTDLVIEYSKLKVQQDNVNKQFKEMTTKSLKDAWTQLGEKIKDVETKIRNAILAHEDVSDLEKEYQELKKQQDFVTKSLQDMVKQQEESAKGWKAIEKAAREAEDIYKYMLSNSLNYTEASIKEAGAIASGLSKHVEYTKALQDTSSVMEITAENARKLAEDLVDNLFEPLKEGETMWDRFKDAGLSALKAILAEVIKTRGSLALKGFQAAAASNPTGNKFLSGILGFGSGVERAPLEGTRDNPTYGRNGGKWLGAFDKISRDGSGGTEEPFNWVEKAQESVRKLVALMNDDVASATQNAAVSLTNLKNPVETVKTSFDTAKTAVSTAAQTVTSLAATTTTSAPAIAATSTAITTMGAAVKPVVGDLTSAADSTSRMAVAAPIAAAGFGAMAASFSVLAPTAPLAATALQTITSPLGTIAPAATAAATAVGGLAVAMSALSVAMIPFVGGLMAPAAAAATAAAIAGGATVVGAGVAGANIATGFGQMVGGALSGAGNKLSGVSSVIPHAKGGVVNTPTTFPMQGGNVGLAGEAGMEVIAPARRMSNGDVGIGAVAPQVTVNNYANAAVEVIKRPDNEMEIKITELNAMLSSSRTNKGFENAQMRVSPRGRQVG